MNKSILIALILFMHSAVAQRPKGFFKRFELIKKGGHIVNIVDRSLKDYPIFEQYQKWSLDLFTKANSYKNNPTLLSEWDIFINTQLNDNERPTLSFVDILMSINEKDLKQIIYSENVKQVINFYEIELKKITENETYAIVANLNDPTYFYTSNRRNFFNRKIEKWCREYLKDEKIAYFVRNYLSRNFDHLQMRRKFHQSILEYYLLKFSASDLGLTSLEKSQALSSVKEGMLPWWNLLEIAKVRKQWPYYGEKSLSNNKIDGNKFDGQIAKEKITNYHQLFEKEGNETIKDLATTGGLYLKSPVDIYFYHDTSKVLKMRSLIELLYLGLSLQSPNIGTLAQKIFLKSLTDETRIHEGSLVAYFEQQNEKEQARQLRLQLVNAWEL